MGDFGRIEGLSNDISATGLGIVTSTTIPQDVPVEIELKLPKSELTSYKQQSPLIIPATIAWQRQNGDNQYLAGIQFKHLGKTQQQELMQAIEFYR